MTRSKIGTFRKRPIEIQALQLRWDTWSEMCAFAGVGELADGKPQGCFVAEDGSACEGPTDRIGLHIPTLEGVMLATENDWVIRGVNNELYPCKPDVFAKTYEEVSS